MSFDILGDLKALEGVARYEHWWLPSVYSYIEGRAKYGWRSKDIELKASSGVGVGW